MTYATKSILWIVGGPIASVVIGYAAFMFFAFLVGAGFDMDDIGSPSEKFFGSLALPALGIIALGGSLLSVFVGIRFAIAHRHSSQMYIPTRPSHSELDRENKM